MDATVTVRFRSTASAANADQSVLAFKQQYGTQMIYRISIENKSDLNQKSDLNNKNLIF